MGIGFGFSFVRGAVGGAAIATDTAPNTTAPDEKLTFEVPNSDWPVRNVQIVAGDGTTTAGQLWYFEPMVKRWYPHSGVVAAVTPAAPATSTGPDLRGAKLFWQVTGNTGVAQIGLVARGGA